MKNHKRIWLIGGFADTAPIVSVGPISRRLLPWLQQQTQAIDCDLTFLQHRDKKKLTKLFEQRQLPDAIIAHSYGCDFALHYILPRLAQLQWPLPLLITLDPVGKANRPAPQLTERRWVEYWHNAYAQPPRKNRSDYLVDLAKVTRGGAWREIPLADSNLPVPVNHAQAQAMFAFADDSQISGWERLRQRVLNGSNGPRVIPRT